MLEFDPSTKSVKLIRDWTFAFKKETATKRLRTIYDFVTNIVTGSRDLNCFVSERIVVTGKSRDGQQRVMGVILLATESIGVKFYTPQIVKRAVTGYLKASKDAVTYSISKMLNLEEGYKFSSNHASDAAAIALTYLIEEFNYPNDSTESDSD